MCVLRESGLSISLVSQRPARSLRLAGGIRGGPCEAGSEIDGASLQRLGLHGTRVVLGVGERVARQSLFTCTVGGARAGISTKVRSFSPASFLASHRNGFSKL